MRYVDGSSWSLVREDGELILESSVTIGGETFAVRVPCGDGRYLAQRVHELIIAPAIAFRPLDPPEIVNPNDF